ncbi:hypothetical protein C0J52_14679 [Blattella germanica]|nr:hypothetical protein C0J52_14679 [Blattella germanica]
MVRQFKTRYESIEKLEIWFSVFDTPFTEDFKDIQDAALQMELIELRCDRRLREKFMNSSSTELIEFNRTLTDSQFPNLMRNTAKTIAICMLFLHEIAELLKCIQSELGMACLKSHTSSSGYSADGINTALLKKKQKKRKRETCLICSTPPTSKCYSDVLLDSLKSVKWDKENVYSVERLAVVFAFKRLLLN